MKYENASTVAKLAFLCTNFGMALVLFSFQQFLDQFNIPKNTKPLGSQYPQEDVKNKFDPDHLTMFVIAFFFYLLSAIVITCVVTFEELNEGMVGKIIFVISSFIAGIFLVVGLGLYGQYYKKVRFTNMQSSPYALLVGVHALVLILVACALGVASLVKPRSSDSHTTSASGNISQTTVTVNVPA